tara:strand:- start:209 stop:2359 length:2151 start_codon:yes stop_codon:yes gene_type:complete
MPLQQIKFLPGIDKQDTTVGAEGRWVNSDNIRFRYDLPEKVGGWSSLLTDTMVGVARKQHAFVDISGNRYVAIGTDKFLLLYFEGQLYDITPLATPVTSVEIATTDTSPACTLTFPVAHGLAAGDIILLSSVTLPVGTGYTDAEFENKLFQVTTTPSSLTITITQSTNASATIASGGSITVTPYEYVGPAIQSYGYGFGVGEFGGTVSGVAETTLNGAINDSVTTIPLTDSTSFPAIGRVLIDSEIISYTGNAANQLTGCTRGTDGTTAASHLTLALVSNATSFVDWGEAAPASEVSLEPGLWSLDNYGQVLVATIANGKTFTWDAGIASRFTTRASTSTPGYSTSNNPTASRITLISPTTRHLIHLGTETVIGDTDTQDDMFIRFSDQEDINEYNVSAINSAGTFRLQDGTKIMGAIRAKETILVWTDTALYTMKYIGAPFTFGFEQVGTNCGLIGKNAAIEIDGAAFWMSTKGFFLFDGTVKTLPCSVEDYVFSQLDTTKGQQVAAGLNNLFTEIVWYYPNTSSEYNNQNVCLNYSNQNQGSVWYPGTEARTSYIDAVIYPNPFATKFNPSDNGTFPSVIGSDSLGQTVLFEQEVGTDQVNPDGTTTAITSLLESFDFDISVQGDGEFFLAMRRFIPDFKNLQGSLSMTIAVKNYPSQSSTTSPPTPFTITSSTTKVDTRARGRFANVTIQNTGVSETWRFGTLRLDLQPDGRR